jgi:DNA-binding protein YbaB
VNVGTKDDSKATHGGGELSGLLRHAEALQHDLDKALAELKNDVVEGQDAARLVALKVAGDGTVREVRLGGNLDAATRKAFEEALAVALKQVVERIFELRRKRAAAVTKGLALPGLFS